MLSKVILSVGCNDKDAHININGATISTGAVGVYNGEIEKSISVVLYEVELSNVETLCDILKVSLNQECIAVEIVENVNVKFM